MEYIIEFVKENIVAAGLMFAGMLLIVFVLLFRTRKPKEKKEKTVIKTSFDKSYERFEKTHFKKCNKCGGNVPIGDNICQNCGQIPD